MPSPLEQQKDAIRDVMRAERRAIPPAARSAAGEALARHGSEFLSGFGSDTVVAGFLPLAGEIETQFLLADLERRGVSLALPVVVEPGAALAFRRWGVGDTLEDGPHGTRHPLADAPDVTPDIILCPLLAFDARGYRLGYGGGYYDRTLAAIPQARAFGLAYSLQMVDHVPSNADDRPIDAVITETGTLICAAGHSDL